MARVELTEEAKEDLQDLDGSARLLVLKAIKKLANEPDKCGQPLGSTARSDLTTFRKLVVGNRHYRIVYRVERDGTVVVIWVIGKRADDECYRLALSRLRRHDNAAVRSLAETLEEVWKDRRI